MTGQRHVPSVEEVWQAYDRMEVRLTAPLSERMLDLVRVGPGMRVLDLATGRGEPAIPAARRVGPSGSVLGIDVSASALAMARRRADEEGMTNIELRAMDATSLDDLRAAHFNVALIRWGLMYMDASVAALAGARRAMVPKQCSYFSLPRRVPAPASRSPSGLTPGGAP